MQCPCFAEKPIKHHHKATGNGPYQAFLSVGRADEFFGQGLILSVLIGIVLFLLALLGRDLYFSILDPPTDLLLLAREYYKLYPIIMLLYPLSAFLTDIVYTDGDEVLSNCSSILQIVVNIVASVVFCRVWGIVGISFGTLAATVISLLIPLLHFLRKGNSLHFVWHLSLKDTLHISKYGVTDGEQYLCNALLVYFINAFVSSRFGSAFLPIITVIVNLVELTLVFDGIGQAFTPLVNVYAGENNNPCIRDVMRSAQKSAAAEGILFSLALIAFAPFIPRLYSIDPGGMSDQYSAAIRIVAATLVASSFKYAYSSYYIVRDELGTAIVMTFVSDLLAPLLIGVPLSLAFGITGIWIGIAAAPLLSLIAARALLLRRYDRKQLPLLLDPTYEENTRTYDVTLTDENIIQVRDWVDAYLREHDIEHKKRLKILLTLEECCLMIQNRNKGKKIYLQCSVLISDQIYLILRDSGVIFDLTDSDLKITSTNEYLVGILMWKHRTKRNLTTMGYNRSELVF